MAPHWKCGLGQPIAGSNPALSASSPIESPWRHRHDDYQIGSIPEIVPLFRGCATFRFAGAMSRRPAERGSRDVGYAIRHREGVLLFDTGFGFGNDELDERTTASQARRRCREALDGGRASRSTT